MKSFIQRHGEKILGVLSGFDRMRFRGTLLRLTGVGGMVHFLTQIGVLLKDFGAYADDLTQRLRRRLEETAASEGRPVQYLERATDKEELVQKIRADRGVGERGLIAVFRTLEIGPSIWTACFGGSIRSMRSGARRIRSRIIGAPSRASGPPISRSTRQSR